MKTAKGQWIMRLFIAIYLPKNKEGAGKIREEDQERFEYGIDPDDFEAEDDFEYIKVNGFITVYQVLDITRITTSQGVIVALGRLINSGEVQKFVKGDILFTN